MNNIVGWQKSLPLYLGIVSLVLKYFIVINLNLFLRVLAKHVGVLLLFFPPLFFSHCLPQVIYL